MLTEQDLKMDKKYKWIGQREELIYVGKEGSWHQFKLVDGAVIWCEVLSHDLCMLCEILE